MKIKSFVLQKNSLKAVNKSECLSWTLFVCVCQKPLSQSCASNQRDKFMMDETNNKIKKRILKMGYLLSDAEIQAIYKKIGRAKEPENEAIKQNEKVSYLSQAVQKALGLIGY